MNQYDLTAQLAHIYRKGSFSSDNGRKPIIGITANYGEQNAKLAEGYYKQVAQAGGTPVIIPPLADSSDILATLNAIDGDRFARIRKAYPDMEEDDIHLCILTRLQLSNRAIGNIYCISVSAVQHRKLKLKKDVFGEKDPDMTLEQVIINS